MLWAISQLLRGLYALLNEAETQKQLIQSLRPFYALISPTQAGFQSPWRAVGLRMWLIFSFNLMMDSI
jgi:hypothetical protein